MYSKEVQVSEELELSISFELSLKKIRSDGDSILQVFTTNRHFL